MEGLSQEKSETKQAVVKYFRDLKIPVRFRGSKTFFTAYISHAKAHGGSVIFPAHVRNNALTAIYGEKFARNHDNPNAGNIWPTNIAMKYSEWDKFFDLIGQPVKHLPEVKVPSVPVPTSASESVVGILI